MEPAQGDLVPGTAMKVMIDEHRYLQAFLSMVKTKLDLEKKYLADLAALRDSWDPKWAESGISTLVSPFLNHMSSEILHKTDTHAHVMSLLETMPETPAPGDSDPLEVLAVLEPAYREYEKCKAAVTSPEGLKCLQDWSTLVTEYNPWKGRVHILPQIDGDFRKAVVTQNQAAEEATLWYTEVVPSALEHHQQNTEHIKSLLIAVCSHYGDLQATLSTSCSTALNTTASFVSSRFISPRHGEAQAEAKHYLVQKCDYRNYTTTGCLSHAVYGLGPDATANLVKFLVDSVNLGVYWIYRWDWDLIWRDGSAFEVSGLSKDLLDKIRNTTVTKRECIMKYALFRDVPLIPIPKEVIASYRNGISRSKIGSILDHIQQTARSNVLHIVAFFTDGREREDEGWYLWAITLLLCHDSNAVEIIKAIVCKWDFEKDCPLPDGVKRAWRPNGGWVLPRST
ncbi:hypothetical protein M408DRAFT_28692 [Serendipita vermifera MAFF 305830]|uniref:Uncharacterized protein n=1 Tax=Serendipita vermifera MAFF 305830 TaxID=933852 RepID=A0A0C3AT38_SERVB|nr:hypothetical protein M408DRAFT_28692 [Serendipita vermifera MAFF 305830]